MRRITCKADTQIVDNRDDAVIEWCGYAELTTCFGHVAVQMVDLRAPLLSDVLPQ